MAAAAVVLRAVRVPRWAAVSAAALARVRPVLRWAADVPRVLPVRAVLPADSAAADHPAAVLAADAPAEVTAAAVARHAAAEPEDGTDSQYSDDKAVGTENIPSDRFCLPYASELA